MGYIVVPAVETNVTSSVLYGVNIDFQQANIFASTQTIQQEASAQFRNLLLTFPGERYLNPTFGCNLKKIIFEPNVATIKEEINSIIKGATSFFLSFINIERIEVITAEDDPSMNNDVSIKITFTVNESDNSQTITVTGTESGNITVTGG
jgi:phage baseplate assembly protein W